MTDTLLERAKALKLVGLAQHWDKLTRQDHPWLEKLLSWEESVRTDLGTTTRLKNAKLGRFKSLDDFNWQWPKKIDRQTIEQLLTKQHYVTQNTNIILVGNNGTGKTTIAKNIVWQAVLSGHSARFIEASSLLADLVSQESESALTRRLKYYTKPRVLAIDEVGYLSYGTRHADLLFQIINQRYENKPTIITTNKPFTEWQEVFPNATCVVSLVDRLVHHSEVLVIDGESYRLHEARDRIRVKERKQSKAAD